MMHFFQFPTAVDSFMFCSKSLDLELLKKSTTPLWLCTPPKLAQCEEKREKKLLKIDPRILRTF